MPDADEVNKRPKLKIPLFAAAETGTPDTDGVNRPGSTSGSQSGGEGQDVLSTKRVTVRELQPGDLLLWGVPPHAQRIAAVHHKRRLGGLLSRHSVSLSDVDGIQKDYSLSPDRRVVVTTDARLPVSSWDDVATQFCKEMSDADSRWHRLARRYLRPVQPFVRVVRDFQCFAYSIRLQAGFIGILFIVLVFAFGLDALLDSRISVVISIVGAFALERIWSYWRKRVRRTLADGVSMTVRFRPFGPIKRYRYGTLEVTRTGGIIPGESTIRPWSSTQLRLLRGKTLRSKARAALRMSPGKWWRFVKEQEVMAVMTFANDLKGDTTYTCRNIADAIRHRLSDGSSRVIKFTTKAHDPASGEGPSTQINPMSKGAYFDMWIWDERRQRGNFTLELKRYQLSVLADMLEIMDDMRRL